jgi:hypothetical protein
VTMATYVEAKAAGAKFYEGKPCPRGHTRRYVKTNDCAECHRARAAGAELPKIDEDDATPTAAGLVVRPPGKCKHGRKLSETCGECERAWCRRPRVAPVIYDDIHVGPNA